MCGRYTLHTEAKKLAKAIAIAIPDVYQPDYNIGPGREVLSLANSSDTRRANMMHWGLETPQNFHVNARIETADTAPRFRESWENFRCLLPANGFYEWYADGITKQPYYLYPEDREIALLAGLWYPSNEANSLGTCLLLTTEASPAIHKIHHRMPVILQNELSEDWLSCKLRKADVVEAANQVSLTAHSVSRRVNSVRNNDSRLLEATSPLNDDQMMLF